MNGAGAEATFVSNKTASLNQRKEGWGKRWKSYKFCHFQPRFMTRLIQQTQRSSLQFTPDPSEAAYKMVVKRAYAYTGKDLGAYLAKAS